MAIFTFNKDTKKWEEVKAPPPNRNNTKDHVNMRNHWSGQTKVEFSQTTMEKDIADRNKR